MRDFIRCKLYLNKSDFFFKKGIRVFLLFPPFLSFLVPFKSSLLLPPDFKRIQVTKQLNAERKGGYLQPTGVK